MVAGPAAIVVRIHREAERSLADVFAVHLDYAPGWDACDADSFHSVCPANLWLDADVPDWRSAASSEGEEASGDARRKQGMYPHAQAYGVRSSDALSSNLVMESRNVSGMVPTSPLRCFAIIRSALPAASFFSSPSR